MNTLIWMNKTLESLYLSLIWRKKTLSKLVTEINLKKLVLKTFQKPLENIINNSEIFMWQVK